MHVRVSSLEGLWRSPPRGAARLRSALGPALLLGLVLAAWTGMAEATVLTFEPPDYTSGMVPGAPWEIGPGSAATIMADAPYAGSQCLVVSSDYSYFQPFVRYPISILPESGQTVISARVRPANYVPGSYDPGYVTMGVFGVNNDLWDSNLRLFDAAVAFDLRKPYGQPVQAGHYVLYGKDYNAPFGYFLPGVYHEVTITWDWGAGTVRVVVARPDGVTYQEERVSAGRELQRLVFAGWSNYTQDHTRFDNVAFPPYDQPPDKRALMGPFMLLLE